MNRRGQRGYLLISVMVMLIIVAATALLASYDSSFKSSMSAREMLAVEADYVAQAAMQHAIWTANQSACTGYALPATDFGAHSYSATYSPTYGSPTDITAIGTLAGGAQQIVARSGVQVLDIIQPQTIILQPGPEGEDTYIRSDEKNKNFGKKNNLMTDSEVTGAGPDHALLRFDLSSLPMPSMILSAELSLYLHSKKGAPSIVEAHRLQRDWIEAGGDDEHGANWEYTDKKDGSLPWSTPGGDYDPKIESSFFANNIGWYDLDLTTLVQSWHSGTQPNNGVILVSPPASGNNEKKYRSSDSPDTSKRPTLTLTVACECGAACP